MLLGVFDYPETETHPGFNLSLRVNFVDGTSGSTFLRLVGSEGGDGRDLDRCRASQEHRGGSDGCLLAGEDGRGGLRSKATCHHAYVCFRPTRSATKSSAGIAVPTPITSSTSSRRFAAALRCGRTQSSDLGAAAPALACNISYFEDRIVRWDPERMSLV